MKKQIAAESSVPTVTTTRFCHVRIVCSKPITPVIGMSEAGMLEAFAWSWAGPELMPSVKPKPRPR